VGCRCGKGKTKFEALLADGRTKIVESNKEANQWATAQGVRLQKVTAK
jgi:hypothetical protein